MRVKHPKNVQKSPFPVLQPLLVSSAPSLSIPLPIPGPKPRISIRRCHLEQRELIHPHESIALITWRGWNLKSVPKCSALHTHLCFAPRCNTQFSASKRCQFLCRYFTLSLRSAPGYKGGRESSVSKGYLSLWGHWECVFLSAICKQGETKEMRKAHQSLSHTRSTTKSTFIFNLVLSHKN